MPDTAAKPVYDWQLDPTMTAPLLEGQRVNLNPRWIGFLYLKREFGSLFPGSVATAAGDIVRISGSKLTFARQVLTIDALSIALSPLVFGALVFAAFAVGG